MPERFGIAAFVESPTLVARMIRAQDLFSLLNRQVQVPASCVALVWGDSGQPTAALIGQVIESADARQVLFVRTTPFFLDYAIVGLSSQDGFALRACVRLDLRVVPHRSELAAFAQSVLGSGTEVTSGHLRQRCEATVRAALDDFARARSAESLLVPATWEAFGAILVEHFKPLAFASGLVLGPHPTVQFESPDYVAAQNAAAAEQHQRRQLEKNNQLQAAISEARQKHLAHLADLLEQAKRLVAENSSLTLADVIKTFDHRQRGELYEGIAALHRPGVRTEAIIVVAGDHLIRLDPAELSRPAQQWNLSSPAGPLRSVRLASTKHERLFLVGARRGVHLVSLDGELRRTCLLQGRFELKGGFNAAVLLGGSLYSTHSEVGLVRWHTDEDAATHPESAHELCLADLTIGAKAIRDVQLDDAGRLWFSADQRVVGWSPDESGRPILLPLPAVVSALRVAGGHIYAGLDDGRIICWELAEPMVTETLRGSTGGAVRSLGWVRGGGVPRLLIAEGRSQIDLQVIGDSFVGAYCCDQRLRWGFAAEDWIVAVNDRRDRLVLWRWDDPHQPAESVSIGQLCGHSVQDVVLVPGLEEA